MAVGGRLIILSLNSLFSWWRCHVMLKQTMDFFCIFMFFPKYDYIFVKTKIGIVK